MTADAVRLARSPRHLAHILVGVALVLISVSLSAYVPVLALFAVAVGGYLAALATAEGARVAQLTPALDALLPRSARHSRAARLVVPTISMVIVGAILGALLGVRAGGSGMFALLGIAGAPTWAAAVVRAAYREEKQLSGEMIPTPMGAFPTDAFSVFATGIDVAALLLMPTWIAILLSTPSWPLVVVQVACSGLATVWVIQSANRR